MNLTSLRTDTLRKISYQLTTSDYPTTHIDANLNNWYRQCVAWTMMASGIWEFNGEQYTTDLVEDQVEYVLPTFVALNRVEIKYPNSTRYVLASRIDDQETFSAFRNGDIDRGSEGSPMFREFDNSIFIFPASSAAVTDGLAIETIKDITDLSDGSDAPNLNPLVHQILSSGAALDFCEGNELYKKANMLRLRIFGQPGGDGSDGLKYLLEKLASNRDRTARTQVRPRTRSYK